MDRLSERITFQQLATVTNENGFQEEKWIDFYTCWSNKKDMNGKEFFTAMASHVEVITSFKVRYCQKIRDLDTRDFRILHNNKFYNILYIYDVQNSHHHFEFKCKKVE